MPRLKRWIFNARTCARSHTCYQNSLLGFIPVGEKFNGNLDGPPAWDGCECRLEHATLPWWVIIPPLVRPPRPGGGGGGGGGAGDAPPMWKTWVTAGDERVCPICMANERARWITYDANYPSGHRHAPAHRRCRCSELVTTAWSRPENIT